MNKFTRFLQSALPPGYTDLDMDIQIKTKRILYSNLAMICVCAALLPFAKDELISLPLLIVFSAICFFVSIQFLKKGWLLHATLTHISVLSLVSAFLHLYISDSYTDTLTFIVISLIFLVDCILVSTKIYHFFLMVLIIFLSQTLAPVLNINGNLQINTDDQIENMILFLVFFLILLLNNKDNENLLSIVKSEADKLEASEQSLKISNKKLSESEKLLKLITDHTSALVSIHDSNGNYMFASPSFQRLGYTPETLIGQSGFTILLEEDIISLSEQLDKAKKGSLSKAILNYRLKDKSGEIYNFRGSFDAIFKSDGSLERIICIGEDITELQKAQAQREKALSSAAEAKRFALVGQVAGKMAHDFNNILGIIMGNTELALVDCTDDLTKSKLELIYNQTIRGKNLTKNLVAFARDQEPNQEFFPIDEKVDLVLNLLKKDMEGIRVIKAYSHGIPEVLADSGMIEHAMINLIKNSVHAVSLAERPEIIIRTYHQNERIHIEIEDNGCGIPSAFLDNIYEPAFTLKGSKDETGMYKSGIKGTGYGMSNVKRYVEQHKGSISVHSEVQKGTKVTISLRVVLKELTDEEIADIKNETNYTEKYILLVEDEQAISDVQYRILTHDPCNHQVDIANNGQVAIDLISRNEYELVSLDYILPGKINGMDVYHHIRKTNQTIPILFISGNIEFLESIKSLMKSDPYIDHLSKPCKNIDYINRINRLMNNTGI